MSPLFSPPLAASVFNSSCGSSSNWLRRHSPPQVFPPSATNVQVSGSSSPPFSVSNNEEKQIGSLVLPSSLLLLCLLALPQPASVSEPGRSQTERVSRGLERGIISLLLPLSLPFSRSPSVYPPPPHLTAPPPHKPSSSLLSRSCSCSFSAIQVSQQPPPLSTLTPARTKISFASVHAHTSRMTCAPLKCVCVWMVESWKWS